MYVGNGGAGSMQSSICTKDEECTLRTNTFTRSGYKFLGWSTKTTGNAEYIDGQSVTNLIEPGKTVVIYALWEELPLLVDRVFANNTAYADNVASPYVTSSTGIDFSKINATISSYNEVQGGLSEVVGFAETTSYYFGSGYTFNTSTGLYTLTGTTQNTWSNMSDKVSTYPYTCLSNSSTYACSKLYRMFEYNSATQGRGVAYSVTANATHDNGKGLYYTNKNTEGNKKTYYFRGSVDNNYVRFGDSGNGTCTYNGEPIFYMTGPYGTGTWDVTESDCLNLNICDLGTTAVRQDTEIPVRYVLASDELCEYDSSWTKLTNEKATYAPGILWRIVRINEDGTVRLVTDAAVAQSSFNTSGDNTMMGYMFGTVGSTTYADTHKNTNNSTMKTYLDSWYDVNLSNYGSYLADAGFCNDRSVAPAANTWVSGDTALGYGTQVTYYGPYNRISTNKKPQYKCPLTNDLFTLKSSSKGNKALTKAIGLLSADEVAYAGGVYNTNNVTHYLYTGENYWTMSPNALSAPLIVSTLANSNGGIGVTFTNVANGVRPVINLVANIAVSNNVPSGCSSQNGTKYCPYIIDTGNSTISDGTYVVSVGSSNTSYGTVTPSSQTVNEGASAVVTLNPADGHAYVSNTCGGTVTNNIMTIPDVTQNKICTVTFKPLYTVNVSSTNTSYGTVSPTAQTVAAGTYASFTLTPATGYEYASNTCGGSVSGNTLSVYVSADKTCTVTFESTGELLADKILADNTAQATKSSFYTSVSSDTNGKGLYYTSSRTENSGKTYYFRGNVTNNYVKFANIIWRIVRINEDGSVRLIHSSSIGSSQFNNISATPAVGYMYGTTSGTYDEMFAPTNNSTIKGVLDNWYLSKLSGYSSYIADAGFCNDRSTRTVTSGSIIYVYFGAYDNIITDQLPQHKCGSSLYTTSTATTGNKALTYPIGLLTADEVVYAGGLYNDGGTTTNSNSTYYLYTGSIFWTMSPAVARTSSSSYYEFAVAENGSLTQYSTSATAAVRPVINLKSTAMVKSGNGTSGNPYVIK